MHKIKDLVNDVEIIVDSVPTWIGGVWECGDQRFTDPAQDQYEAVVVDTPPIISVTEFKLLFPIARAWAIHAAKSTDTTIAWFFNMLDDLRTTAVDLSLPSVQSMLDYLVTVQLLSAEEKAAILAYRR